MIKNHDITHPYLEVRIKIVHSHVLKVDKVDLYKYKITFYFLETLISEKMLLINS